MRRLARALATRSATPADAAWLLAFFLVTTFAVEMVVMVLLPRVVPAEASPMMVAAADAALLTAILGPITWWVFLVPLMRMHESRGLLMERMLSAQEDERTRIALDLHDGLGQSLTTILMRLRVLGDSALSSEARDNVAAIRQITADSLDDLRQIVHETRPPILADLGLAAALEKKLRDVQDASGLDTTLEWRGQDDARLPLDLETVLYRVIQEAVTNAMRHAAAGRVAVTVVVGPVDVTVIVTDDGVGFDVAGVHCGPQKPFGLLGMQERVRPFGGTVDVSAAIGKGTIVTARLPLANGKATP